VAVTEGAAGEQVTATVEVPDAATGDQRTFADALAELFGPVRTPRFLLETGRGGRSGIVRAVLSLARGSAEQYLPVPSAIGRKRADAEAFASAWEREVGPCTLHEIDSPAMLALLARARRGAAEALAPATRERWR
jgi:hypothetical protein